MTGGKMLVGHCYHQAIKSSFISVANISIIIIISLHHINFVVGKFIMYRKDIIDKCARMLKKAVIFCEIDWKSLISCLPSLFSLGGFTIDFFD